MPDHPNMALMLEMRDRWNRGDLQGFLGRCADDIVARVGGKSLLTGTYRGKQEYMGYIGQLAELSGGSIKVSFDDVLARGHVRRRGRPCNRHAFPRRHDTRDEARHGIPFRRWTLEGGLVPPLRSGRVGRVLELMAPTPPVAGMRGSAAPRSEGRPESP